MFQEVERLDYWKGWGIYNLVMISYTFTII
jgi:hypothetical protein